jgi:hypothetical protein
MMVPCAKSDELMLTAPRCVCGGGGGGRGKGRGEAWGEGAKGECFENGVQVGPNSGVRDHVEQQGRGFSSVSVTLVEVMKAQGSPLLQCKCMSTHARHQG